MLIGHHSNDYHESDTVVDPLEYLLGNLLPKNVQANIEGTTDSSKLVFRFIFKKLGICRPKG